jgi:hypothetical protein
VKVQTLLSAVQTAGASNPYRVGHIQRNHVVQINLASNGTLSALTVALQGSLDNSNWNTLESRTVASASSVSTDRFKVYDAPTKYIRANITTYTSATSAAKITVLYHYF